LRGDWCSTKDAVSVTGSGIDADRGSERRLWMVATDDVSAN
jgi:hypothetical protein